MTVIPAINVGAGDDTELARQLEAVRGHAARVHVDVSDGTFAPTITWSDPARVRELAGPAGIQAHLMVARPEAILASWLDAGADEIVVHLEPLLEAGEDEESPTVRLAAMRDACVARGAKLLIAAGPDLESRALLAYRSYAAGFLVLAVHPGLSGQRMQETALETVAVIREAFPDDEIWVDGGVNAETVARIRAAGASGAVAASAVFDAEDPVSALAALQ